MHAYMNDSAQWLRLLEWVRHEDGHHFSTVEFEDFVPSKMFYTNPKVCSHGTLKTKADPMEHMCAVAAEHPPSPAKLMLGDRVLATGEARLESGQGTYWTSAQNTQNNYPESGASLIVSGIPLEVTLTRFHRCPADPPHYHFQYDSEA